MPSSWRTGLCVHSLVLSQILKGPVADLCSPFSPGPFPTDSSQFSSSNLQSLSLLCLDSAFLCCEQKGSQAESWAGAPLFPVSQGSQSSTVSTVQHSYFIYFEIFQILKYFKLFHIFCQYYSCLRRRVIWVPVIPSWLEVEERAVVPLLDSLMR